MTKTIIVTVVLTLFGSATFAMARAEGRTGKCGVAKTSKKDRAPEPKKNEKNTKQTAIGALPEKKDVEIVIGNEVSMLSGLVGTKISMRTVILAVQD